MVLPLVFAKPQAAVELGGIIEVSNEITIYGVPPQLIDYQSGVDIIDHIPQRWTCWGYTSHFLDTQISCGWSDIRIQLYPSISQYYLIILAFPF